MPATDIISISGLHEPAAISIYDATGRQVMHTQTNPSGTIDISGLGKGLYLIKMEVSGNTGHTRFVKL